MKSVKKSLYPSQPQPILYNFETYTKDYTSNHHKDSLLKFSF